MITKTLASAVLERALGHGADFAELYCEQGESLTISYNRTVTDLTKARSRGAGLYLLKGTQSVYVYTNDLSEASLISFCDRAGALLRAKATGAAISDFSSRDISDPNPISVYPSTIAHAEKIKLLDNADRAARGTGSDVVDISADYFDSDKRVIIANSEGVWAEDSRVTSRLRLTPTVANEHDSTGYFVEFSRPMGFEAFKDGSYVDFATGAIAEMRASLSATETPNGHFPVILDAGTPSGTFFHECCGHQLETNGDLVNNGIFHGKLGTKVATDIVTLMDDGTMPFMYGSSRFDDEGMPRQCNTIIENGVLKSYFVDRLGSRKLNVARNACGRRQNYTVAPAARMSNTYVAPGTDNLDEMIRSMPEGLYITRMGGGQGGADFTIVAHTAFWIKNGAIDRQVKNATLMGRGNESLLKIDRVADELVLEKSGMFCGGASGLCNVTTSGAAIRISEMLIGGKGGNA